MKVILWVNIVQALLCTTCFFSLSFFVREMKAMDDNVTNEAYEAIVEKEMICSIAIYRADDGKNGNSIKRAVQSGLKLRFFFFVTHFKK
jgi:hypothetical protein